MQTIEVGVLGATGMVGQHFIKFSAGPSVVRPDVAGRERPLRRQEVSRRDDLAPGRRHAGDVADLMVEECKPGNAPQLLFSAMDASVATEIERAFARGRPRRGFELAEPPHGSAMCRCWCRRSIPITCSSFRGSSEQRGWKGQIVTNPNCSTIVLTHGAGAAQAVRHQT